MWMTIIKRVTEKRNQNLNYWLAVCAIQYTTVTSSYKRKERKRRVEKRREERDSHFAKYMNKTIGNIHDACNRI